MGSQVNRIPAYGSEEWSQRYPINEQTPVPPNYSEIRRLRAENPSYTLDFYVTKSSELVKKGFGALPINRMIFARAKKGNNIQFGVLVTLSQIYGCPVENIAHLDEIMSDGPRRYMPIEFQKTIERFFLTCLTTALAVIFGCIISLYYMELDEARLTILVSGGIYCLMIGAFFASRKGLVLPIAILLPAGLLFGLITSLLSYVFVLQLGDDMTVNLLRSPNYIIIDIVFTLVCALFLVSPRLVRLMRPMKRENLLSILISAALILFASLGWIFTIWQTLRIQAAM